MTIEYPEKSKFQVFLVLCRLTKNVIQLNLFQVTVLQLS